VSQIEEYLRNAVISRLTDLLGKNMTSLFDLPALFNDISAGMRAQIQEDFDAVGIALKQFMLVSITPTDDTAKAIDERASMGAIGNMDAYMKFKTARAIGDAAQQSGGGTSEGLGLGAGVGLGAGLAGMIANTMNSAQQASQSAPVAAAAASVPDVMTLEEAASYLRVTAADVQSLVDSGEIKAKKIGAQYRISREAIDNYLNA
jgi:excisionase family DNA binding protein